MLRNEKYEEPEDESNKVRDLEIGNVYQAIVTSVKSFGIFVKVERVRIPGSSSQQ